MLKSIKITNFYSIGTEQNISLNISSKDALDDSAREVKNGCFINTVMAIVGANSSGKTNILKSLSFLAWFITKSYSSLKAEKSIPIEPHQLYTKKPISFEIEFYEKEILYRYFLKLDKKHVLYERLDKKNDRWNKTPLFELIRDSNEAKLKEYSIKRHLNEDDWSRIKERNNIALLSALIDLNYLPEINFFKNIQSNVSAGGHQKFDNFHESIMISQKLYNDKQLQKDILNFSKEIDLGISDFTFHQVSLRNREDTDDDKKTHILECKHTSQIGSFTLPIFEESNGTQRGFSILSDILPILKEGGLMVLDEIEDGIHPSVIKKIISLFENKKTNPKNAQIIFSTHQHFLLNDRTKTQILITSKDNKSLESEVYRLDDIEGVRNDENYFHKYITGIYGGTPNVKWI